MLMYKLAGIVLTVLMTFGCSKGQLKIDLSKEINVYTLKPKHATTSTCTLKIHGKIDCYVTVKMDSEKSLKFEPGVIDFTRTYEWYEKGKTIEVYSDSCTVGSFLLIEYYFSSGYFGQK